MKHTSTTTLFAGLDLASKAHAVCVVDGSGAIRVRFEIANTGKTFAGLVKRLTKLSVAGVAIERCDGPLVEALLDAGPSGAVGLFARLDSDVAIAFLRRYPTQHAAERLIQACFAAFLRRIAYSGRKPIEELFARVHDAPAAGLTATEADRHAVCVLALVRAIETTRREERELQADIVELLDAHAYNPHQHEGAMRLAAA